MLIPKLFFFSGICRVEFKYNWTILRFSNSLIEIMWKHNPVGMPIPGPAHFYSTGVGNRRRPTFNWITSNFAREREREADRAAENNCQHASSQKVVLFGILKSIVTFNVFLAQLCRKKKIVQQLWVCVLAGLEKGQLFSALELALRAAVVGIHPYYWERIQSAVFILLIHSLCIVNHNKDWKFITLNI